MRLRKNNCSEKNQWVMISLIRTHIPVAVVILSHADGEVFIYTLWNFNWVFANYSAQCRMIDNILLMREITYRIYINSRNDTIEHVSKLFLISWKYFFIKRIKMVSKRVTRMLNSQNLPESWFASALRKPFSWCNQIFDCSYRNKYLVISTKWFFQCVTTVQNLVEESIRTRKKSTVETNEHTFAYYSTLEYVRNGCNAENRGRIGEPERVSIWTPVDLPEQPAARWRRTTTTTTAYQHPHPP